MKAPEKDVEKILKTYGRKMKLKEKESGKETVFKAFLQPLRYKNKMYLSAVSTELRYDSSRKYLLIAPPDISLDRADGYELLLTDGKMSFIVDHSEKIFLGEKVFYTWAVVSAL